jgi:hypothetical protein
MPHGRRVWGRGLGQSQYVSLREGSRLGLVGPALSTNSHNGNNTDSTGSAAGNRNGPGGVRRGGLESRICGQSFARQPDIRPHKRKEKQNKDMGQVRNYPRTPTQSLRCARMATLEEIVSDSMAACERARASSRAPNAWDFLSTTSTSIHRMARGLNCQQVSGAG